MSSHTPGPWTIDDYDFCVYAKSSDGISEVLVASVQESGRNLQVPRIGEDEANLALIAAAPELLSLLKWCVDFYGSMGVDDSDTATHDTIQLNAIAAIIKAQAEVSGEK